MKKLILLLMLLFNAIVLTSQSLSPSLVSAAGYSSENSSVILDWSLGEPAIETFSTAQYTLNQGFQQAFGPSLCSGVMHYLNTASTPIRNSVAYLKTLSGGLADSALTTHSGSFNFFHAAPGAYLTHGTTGLSWGGANATDALLILKHFVGIAPLSGMYKRVADVNLATGVNSQDALLVAKRFVEQISYFPLADWVFSNDTVFIGTSLTSKDINVLCAGDVNGTHLPGSKAKPSVSLVRGNMISCISGKVAEIPLLTKADLTIAAISLVMNLPAGVFNILDVKFVSTEGSLIWKQSGNQLRIAWYSQYPCSILSGSPVITLQSEIRTPSYGSGEIPLPGTGPESEIAAFDGSPLEEAILCFPRIIPEIGGPEGVFVSCCSPNPSEGNTLLTYRANMAGQMFISLMDMTGRILEEQIFSHDNAGTYECRVNTENYPAGYYIVRTRLSSISDSYSSASKISIVK